MNVTDFKAKEAVRLRTKPIKNGNLSLYLDIYHKGRRRYEFLRLYLISEHNSQDRNRNRHSLEVAHRIRNRRLAELQETLYTDRHNLHRQRLNFLDYIDTFCQNHGAAYRSLSMGLKRHLILYKGPVIPFSSITKSFLRGFHHYLNQAQAGGNVSKHSARLLSAGTKWNYFNILSLLLNKACREGYFLRNPMHELSAEAVKQLPDDPSREGLVFKHLPDASYTSKLLKRWTQTAGLRKHVTFHMARHTFATLGITYGAELYTISKLLGHSNIRITQIYADIISQKKREAVDSIPPIGV